MVIIVDSSILVSYLIMGQETIRARQLLKKCPDLAVTPSILEETTYIGLSLIYNNKKGKDLKQEIIRGLSSNAKKFIGDFDRILALLDISIVESPKQLRSMTDIIEQNGLLPADAMISATCLTYKMDLATFDKDFHRVPNLTIIQN